MNRAGLLSPRTGTLDVFGWARRAAGHTAAGAGLEYLHNLGAGSSAFARGTVGYDSVDGTAYSVLGGVRLHF